MATNTYIYIFDAKDNSLWMTFDRSKTTNYSTGTATFTNTSTAVTGSGTAWLTNARAGDRIADASNAHWYTIASVNSDTSITLVNAAIANSSTTYQVLKENMAGSTATGSQGADVTGLNGTIYIGSNGSNGGLYVVNFKTDSAKRYTAEDDYVGNQNIASRNAGTTTILWSPGPGAALNNNTTTAGYTAPIGSVSTQIYNGKTYVLASESPTGGLNVINETDQTNIIITQNGATGYSASRAYLTTTGKLYVGYRSGGTNGVEYSNLFVYNTLPTVNSNNAGNITYAPAGGSVLSSSASLVNNLIGSGSTPIFYNFAVTEGTSTVDGKSNTIYLATDNGLQVLQEKAGDEANGSLKLYTNTYITEEMLGDIRANYPLDNNVGSGLTETSNNGYTLTNGSTAPTYASSGVRNQAATLGAAAAEAHSTGANLIKNINTVKTVSAWVFPTTVTNTNGTREMWVSSDANTASKVSWGIGTKGDGGNAIIYCFANGSSFTEISTAIPALTSTWYHVALTSDGSGNLKCYVNGVQAGTGSVTSPETPTRFQIGATQTTTAFNAVVGRVDEVMVSATQATASQIKHIYEVGFRALQNHTAKSIRGGTTSADANQILGGNTSVNWAVAASLNTGMIYAGTYASGGGVSVIGMDDDTLHDLYTNTTGLSSISIPDDQNASTTWSTNQSFIRSVSVSKGYGTGMIVAFGQNNSGSGGVWLESNDTSLKDFLATSYNPFGYSLNQSQLNVDNMLRVVGQLSTRLDEYALGSGSTGGTQPYLAEAFRVDSNGGLLSRSLVNSATAMQFQDASGTTLLNLDTTNGRVGIGTTAPATQVHLDVSNSSTLPQLKINQQSTGDAALFFSLNSTAVYSMGIDNSDGDKFKISNDTGGADLGTNTLLTITSSGSGGFVGIGTTGPINKLEVIKAGSNNTLPAEYGMRISNGSTSDGIAFGDFTTYKAIQSFASTPLSLNPAGNSVGIGTTNPGYKLHVVDTSSAQTGGIIENASSGTNATAELAVRNGTAITDALRLMAFGTSYSTSGIFVADGAMILAESNLSGGLSVGTRGSTPLKFVTADTEFMRMTSAGLVGIGTTNPGYVLQVNGTNEVAGFVANNNSGFGTVNLQNTNTGSSAITGISNNLYTTSAASVYAGGMFIGKEQSWTSTASTQDSYMMFQTTVDGSSNERMRITSGGNVGIGTTAPTNGRFELSHSPSGDASSIAQYIGYVPSIGATSTNRTTTTLSLNNSPSATVSNVSSQTNYGINNNVSISNLTMGNSNSALTTINAYGINTFIQGTPVINNTSAGNNIVYNMVGTTGAIYTNTPTFTSVAATTNFMLSYGGFFDNQFLSGGNANTNAQAYGLYAQSIGNLTTTGATSHYGGFFFTNGTADTNYTGYFSSSNTATTNYGVYIAGSSTGNTNYGLVVDSNSGNSGFGTVTPSVLVHINSSSDTNILRLQDSNGTCDHNPGSSSEAVSCSSDARLKSNIGDVASDPLAEINSLKIRDFTWNATGDRFTGVIAQEVLATLPDLVQMGDDGYYKVTGYNAWKTLRAIQQLDQKIEQTSNLKLDQSGTLIIPNIKTDHLKLASINQVVLSTNGDSINAATMTQTGTPISFETIADNINNNFEILASALNTQEAKSDVLATQIASNSANLAQAVSSTSSAIDDLNKRINELLGDTQATQSAEPNLEGLTPPSSLISTGSATLADLNITNSLTSLKLTTESLQALDATVSGSFKSLGETFLGNTVIAGSFTQDGSLSITNGNTINSLGTLFIQNSPLANMVDFFNGAVTISKEGILTAQKLTIPAIKAAGSANDPSIGSAKIIAGQTEVAVLNNQVKNSSKVFVTAKTKTGGQALIVSSTVENSGFIVSLDHSITQDVTFDWWIIETQ